MNISAAGRGVSASRGRRLAWLYKTPRWTIVVFFAAVFSAYSPNVFQVFAIHGGYEMLRFKNPHFFHMEAEHLFALARPVAGFLTNLTVLPLQSLADIRWTRLFSTLTVCVAGTQMISMCVVRLRTKALDAVAVSLATFLVLGFIFSVLDPSAWVMHLLTVLLAMGSYATLSRANVQAMPFLPLVTGLELRAFCRQLHAYFCLRPVWAACAIYQVALYNYPPYALIVAVFPLVAVLFSQASRTYRTVVAFRDLFFISANVAIYLVSAKLIYLPVVRLFLETPLTTDTPSGAEVTPFSERVGATYHFKFNTDPWEMLQRLGRLMEVSGDLWFLPQFQIHLLVTAAILLAFVVANVGGLSDRGRTTRETTSEGGSIARLRMGSWHSDALVILFVLASCFVISATPLLASGGGFVVYRTALVTTAITAIFFIYAVRSLAEALWSAIGKPFTSAATVANVALAMTAGAAYAGSLYSNYLTMKLARNEFAYFKGIVEQAIAEKSDTIIVIDRQRFTLPEDHPRVYDARGRPVPPYELGCFSSYCNQTDAIIQVAATAFGRPVGSFKTAALRSDYPVPGMTCEMLTAPTPLYPTNASDKSISVIKYYRGLAPLTCVTYSRAWHDLDFDIRR